MARIKNSFRLDWLGFCPPDEHAREARRGVGGGAAPLLHDDSGQAHREGRALLERAMDFNRAIVGFGNPFGDR